MNWRADDADRTGTLRAVERGNATAERLAPGTAMALVAMGLGVLVIANDFTALNVALPAIEGDLDADVGTVQWVINAYALTFGMAIVTGGRLADMFGRRRAFFLGAVIFATFSLLGGIAQSIPWLIAARVAMGIGGALMWPAILGMTYAALPASRAGLAGGLILGAAGIGNALGPLIGGVLTDELSWRWIFFLNVPIAAFAVAVTLAKVPADAGEEEREGIDYAGIATLSAGLLLTLLAFDQAADWGWGDPRVIAMFVLAAVLVTTFAVIEPRIGRKALVPSDVIRNRQFRGACMVTLLMSAVFFSTVLYAPQFMEKILGYSALKAGLGLLPMLGTFAVVSFVAGPLYERIGPKIAVSSGAVGLCIGPFLLSRIDATSSYESLIAGLAITGIGVGLFYASITTAAVTALDPSRASLAGGLVYMFQIAGGAIGLGVTTTIFTTSSENELAEKAGSHGVDLTAHQTGVLHGILAGTDSSHQALAELPKSAVTTVQDVVRDSFASGLQAGFRFVAIAALAGLVISLLYVGGRPEPEPELAPEAA
jgi:EmrB/QacA subfamily drug resistance transporter